jgi:hydroxymethylbilane synthase
VPHHPTVPSTTFLDRCINTTSYPSSCIYFAMASATVTDAQAPTDTNSQGLNTSAATQVAPINIGTRNSVLAQIQARAVESTLKKAFPDRTYNICPVVVQGDRDKITPLQQLSQGENAKSLWTGELESMLESGDLDIIVHCLKGVPPDRRETLDHV